MTFKDVILKNFFGSLSKYISYFISGAFCTAVFFIYSTIMMMDNVTEGVSEYPLQALFIVTCLMISLFSVFFISYSHRSFVRNKKKELGVYMIVGMDENDTRRMLGIETLIIATAATITGMLAGWLFSRFFQMVIIALTEVEDREFRLSIWNFILTAGVFAIIYAACFFKTDQQMKREDISTIIKEERKSEGKLYKKADCILALIGLIGMIFSTIFVLTVSTNVHINSKLWVLLTIVISGYGGLFLLINYGGRTFVWLTKRRKKYYNKMLAVSEINHKYSENIKVTLILAILASMIVLLVGSPIALVTVSADIAEDGNRDIEFMALEDYNRQAVEEILDSKQIEAWDVTEVSYGYDAAGLIKPVIAVSDFNQRMGTSLAVNEGELYNIKTTWIPGTMGIDVGSMYTIYTEPVSQNKEKTLSPEVSLDAASVTVNQEGGSSNEFTFSVCESVKGNWICPNMFKSMSVLIISDNDFNTIKTDLNHGMVNELTFADGWKDTKELAAAIREILGSNSMFSSRIDTFYELRHGYSVFLFVTCSMCLLFFISTVCVLYFKQYNDIDDEKQQYKKLFKLGIDDKTVSRTISTKMAVVYFTPLIGSVMGVLLMYYMSSLFGGGSISNIFMQKGILGFICYAAAQTLFYIIIRTRYVHDVLMDDTNIKRS